MWSRCARTPEFDAENPPCLLNPAVLVDVLSPSAEDKDRRENFMEYRELASVTDYILISQTKIQVTHYARQSELQWLVTTCQRREDILTLNALNVSLYVSDIYRKIVFAALDASSWPERLPRRSAGDDAGGHAGINNIVRVICIIRCILAGMKSGIVEH